MSAATSKLAPAEAIAIALTCSALNTKHLIGPQSQEVKLVLMALDQAGWNIVAKGEGK